MQACQYYMRAARKHRQMLVVMVNDDFRGYVSSQSLLGVIILYAYAHARISQCLSPFTLRSDLVTFCVTEHVHGCMHV